MTLRIRFALRGVRNKKMVHIVATEQSSRRDGRPLELLGIYDRHANSMSKTIEWSPDRIRYWLSIGAKPSQPVIKLLKAGKLLKQDNPFPPKPIIIKSPPVSDRPKTPTPTADLARDLIANYQK